jgi:hypothetical protein
MPEQGSACVSVGVYLRIFHNGFIKGLDQASNFPKPDA